MRALAHGVTQNNTMSWQKAVGCMPAEMHKERKLKQGIEINQGGAEDKIGTTGCTRRDKTDKNTVVETTCRIPNVDTLSSTKASLPLSFRGHCVGAVLSFPPSQVFWDFQQYSPQGDRRSLHGARLHAVAGGESHTHFSSTRNAVRSVCNHCPSIRLSACLSVSLSQIL